MPFKICPFCGAGSISMNDIMGNGRLRVYIQHRSDCFLTPLMPDGWIPWHLQERWNNRAEDIPVEMVVEKLCRESKIKLIEAIKNTDKSEDLSKSLYNGWD